jgi:predicted Zn-dependent peptidase
VAIVTKELSNGLSVIVEEMDHVESAAYDLVIPGGLITDKPDSVGSSLVFAELVSKGAGAFDSRELSDAFDSAGIRHGEGVGMDRYALSGSLVAGKLGRALELVSLMVVDPRLPADDIPAIQSLLLQDLEALKDNPARRATVELTERFYPEPFNRSSLGKPEGIQSVTESVARQMHADFFRPRGAILSIAGKVEAPAVMKMVDELFGSWSGEGIGLPEFGKRPSHDYYHIDEDSAQLQIVMASPSVKFSDPLFYEGKIVASILGSSMFGRLFVEVREKRGLCYSVFARHGATNQYGTMTAYVGTTAERAQESMDVLLAEFEKFPGTISQEEIDRARTNLKANLIMGEESSGARAGSNATDWWLLRRVRSIEEIQRAIDAVTLESIEQYLREYPCWPSSILTLGRHPLRIAPHVIGRG